MKKKTATSSKADKNDQLNDAIYKQDKEKAKKLFAEIKSKLTEGDRAVVAKQIARIPASKAKKAAKK